MCVSSFHKGQEGLRREMHLLQSVASTAVDWKWFMIMGVRCCVDVIVFTEHQSGLCV